MILVKYKYDRNSLDKELRKTGLALNRNEWIKEERLLNSMNLSRNTVDYKLRNFPPSWFAYYSSRIDASTIGFDLWTQTDFFSCNFPGNKRGACQQSHILDNNCLEEVKRSTINSIRY